MSLDELVECRRSSILHFVPGLRAFASIDVWSRSEFESLPDHALDASTFEMPPWILEALSAQGILQVRDLFDYSQSDLEGMEGLGEVGARVLVQFLHDLGIIEESEAAEVPLAEGGEG